MRNLTHPNTLDTYLNKIFYSRNFCNFCNIFINKTFRRENPFSTNLCFYFVPIDILSNFKICQRLLANTSLPILKFKVKLKNYNKKKVVSKVN